ncbi:hypothetical protein [Kerstersia sp.]|uniref:hypothetical protein n=1 Tax=Kerstersia sp. TaxID=1930783 RepID=UPI003F93EDF4
MSCLPASDGPSGRAALNSASPPAQLPPLVLDTDDSVGILPGEIRLALPQDWREAVRFGCRLRVFRERMQQAMQQMPAATKHGTLFMGSGDFHHLSWPLIERCLAARQGRIRVLVLDNHPDNMRFPWGIHCGSWVGRLAMHPQVAHVHVAGITSHDVGLAHAWEHQLQALRAGKLSYWCMGVDTRWAAWLGLSQQFHVFPGPDALVQALSLALASQPFPCYLSIDKDVFAPEVVRTNWDQGRFLPAHLETLLDALRGQIIGSDVTGEVSVWRYRDAWKRWLSAADGQDTAQAGTELPAWQARQAEFNQYLLAQLARVR